MPTSPLAQPAQQTIEEIFLTPRVLDRRAYDEYAASLTRLIQDASGQGQELSRTAADVRVLRDQLAQTAAEAQKRLDNALKLISAIDQRGVASAAPSRNGRHAKGDLTSDTGHIGNTPIAPATPAPTPAPTEAASLSPVATTRLVQAIEARLTPLVEARIKAEIESGLTRALNSRVPDLVAEHVRQALDERLSGLDQHFEQALSTRLEALTGDVNGLKATIGVSANSVAGETIAQCRAMIDTLRREVWSLVEESRGLASASADRARSVEAAVSSLRAEIIGTKTSPVSPAPDLTLIESAVQNAAERARSFERSVESAARRFASETNEQGAKVTAAAREAIETARVECEAAARQISTGAMLRVRKAQADVDAVLDSLDSQLPERLDAARGEFARLLESLSAEAQERASWLKAALAQAESSGLLGLKSTVEDAKALLDPERDGSLVRASNQAAALHEGVQTSIVQLGDLSKQVGLMRDLLARSIMDGVARIDSLDARVEELLLSTARSIERYSVEIDSLRATLNAGPPPTPATGQIEGIAEGAIGSDAPSDAPPTDAAESLTHVEQRIEELKGQIVEASQAAEWLAGLIDRAARAGIAMDEPTTESTSRGAAKPRRPTRARTLQREASSTDLTAAPPDATPEGDAQTSGK